MPWGIRRSGDSVCVYKKTTGKTLHCYSGAGAEAKAKKYLAALHANVHEKQLHPGVIIKEESDGRYAITTVSTAAVRDQDDETFDVAAIDWDIKEAEANGDYPEYRMFHKKSLAIGRVEKMERVGIFAVDHGHSYTDPFSIAVCKEILAKNNGKWRCSRGFYVHEASGTCPNCHSDMIVTKEHMVVGFKCPTCKAVHMSYKGVLKEIHFRKARTFDVTITDIPCVPYTGVSAKREDIGNVEVSEMLKSQIKQKLLEAGIEEKAIDERLQTYSDEQLKELTDIPEAILKEFDVEVVDEDVDVETEVEDEVETKEDDDTQTFVLDASVLKEFAKIVDSKITERLDGLEIDIETPEEKEYTAIDALTDKITALTTVVEKMATILTGTDRERLKEILEETPRNGKLRVVRFQKAAKPDPEEEEDYEDDEEEDDEDMPTDKRMQKKERQVVIKSADGKLASNMTEFILGK